MADEITKFPPGLAAADEAAEQFTYGDLIDHQWLNQAFEVQWPEQGTRKQMERCQLQFMSEMDRFREALLTEYRMALQSIPGKGYRVVPVKEQTSVAMKQCRNRVSRVLRRTMQELEFIQYDMLNAEERQNNLEAKAKVAFIGAAARRRKVLPGN